MKLSCPCGSDEFLKVYKVTHEVRVDSKGQNLFVESGSLRDSDDEDYYECTECGKPVEPVWEACRAGVGLALRLVDTGKICGITSVGFLHQTPGLYADMYEANPPWYSEVRDFIEGRTQWARSISLHTREEIRGT